VQELQGLKPPPAAAVTTPTDSALQGLLVNEVEGQSQAHHAQQGAQISAQAAFELQQPAHHMDVTSAAGVESYRHEASAHGLCCASTVQPSDVLKDDTYYASGLDSASAEEELLHTLQLGSSSSNFE